MIILNGLRDINIRPFSVNSDVI